MSIVTKTGDQGTTGLMYNRRVSKSDPRIDTFGTVDELTAALGMARAWMTDAAIREKIYAIQQDLVSLMGELATLPGDMERYRQDGFQCISREHTAKLEQMVADLEAQKITYRGWALPGDSRESAPFDIARTVCRRAERRVASLLESGGLENREILVYLNRLADLLWLFARKADLSSKS